MGNVSRACTGTVVEQLRIALTHATPDVAQCISSLGGAAATTLLTWVQGLANAAG